MFGAIFYVYKKEVQKMNDLIELKAVHLQNYYLRDYNLYPHQCDGKIIPLLFLLFAYEYQKAERLVYCNYLEHLLLHIRIGKDKYWKEHESFTFPKEFDYFIVPGITYICSEINDLFEKNGSAVEWRNRCFKEIEGNFDDYIYILKSFVEYMIERYTGNREQKTIYVGQHIRHKRLGEGVITKITGEELFGFVTVKFADCEKIVLRNVIDKGGYEETLIQVKKKLSSNRNHEIIKLIYEKLQ